MSAGKTRAARGRGSDVVVELRNRVDNIDNHEPMMFWVARGDLAAGDFGRFGLDFDAPVFGPVVVILFVMFAAFDRFADSLVVNDDLESAIPKRVECRPRLFLLAAAQGALARGINYFTRQCRYALCSK
jgi:hypothetical protein